MDITNRNLLQLELTFDFDVEIEWQLSVRILCSTCVRPFVFISYSTNLQTRTVGKKKKMKMKQESISCISFISSSKQMNESWSFLWNTRNDFLKTLVTKQQKKIWIIFDDLVYPFNSYFFARNYSPNCPKWYILMTSNNKKKHMTFCDI